MLVIDVTAKLTFGRSSRRAKGALKWFRMISPVVTKWIRNLKPYGEVVSDRSYLLISSFGIESLITG